MRMTCLMSYVIIFFFNDTATTEIYTLSLHDALPICAGGHPGQVGEVAADRGGQQVEDQHGRADEEHEHGQDRKSTRLNSSHANISYAVFCLKKKKKPFYEDANNRRAITLISMIHKLT